MRNRFVVLSGGLALLLQGCPGDDGITPDAAPADAAPPDAPITPPDAAPSDAAWDAAASDAAPSDAAWDAAALDAAPSDAAALDAAPSDAAVPDAAPTCAAPPANLSGVYRGTATISVFWSSPLGYEDPPSCSELAGRYVTDAVLDISGPPYEVSLALADSPDHMLVLDLSTPASPGELTWEPAASGFGIYDRLPCERNFASDYYEPATVFIDPANATATFHAHCESAFADSCGFSTNYATDWEAVLPLSCVKGQTVYIGGSVVTCDELGNITTSELCSDVPGCTVSRPDLCSDGTTPFCTTLQADRDNCGQCEHACALDEDCVDGACVGVCSGAAACPDAYSGTATSCEDLSSSPGNCGACDHFCTILETCSGGQCVGVCPPEAPDRCSSGFGTFAGCADLSSDPANCGTCFHACADLETCQAGTCVR